jgi:hypothetical protein
LTAYFQTRSVGGTGPKPGKEANALQPLEYENGAGCCRYNALDIFEPIPVALRRLGILVFGGHRV